MKIIFIDETEKQRGKNNTYYFVLCGLVINADILITLSEDLEKIREEYKLNTLKDARKKSLKKEIKLEISNKICNNLKKSEAEIRSIFLGNVALRAIPNADNKYFEALSFLIERFFLSLKEKDDTGMVIFDSLEKRTENRLRKKFFDYIQKEKLIWETSKKIEGHYKERIYPSILFSDDKYSLILQTTDLIATSLNSAIWKILSNMSNISDVEEYIEELPKYNEYLEIYWPLFAKNPRNGNVKGWGIKVWI